MFIGLPWNLDEGVKELNLTTCRSHFKFNLGHRTVLVIIIHSKHFSVSDWLKPLATSSQPANVDQIWKTFSISSKMTSVLQNIDRKRHSKTRSPWGQGILLDEPIISSSIYIILHIIRKPNPIVAMLFFKPLVTS